MFDTEEEYYSAQKANGMEHPMSATHFIPAGLFVSEGELPGPQASFSGTVVGGGVLTNSITQIKTLHLSVQTLEMSVDIMADPTLVKGRPKKGGLVSGLFYMSGRPKFDIQDLQQWIDSRAA